MTERDVDLGAGAVVDPPEQALVCPLSLRELRDVVLLEHLTHETAVRLRDHAFEGGLVEHPGIPAGVHLRHDHVDAVGLPAHVLVDPAEFDLELVRRKGERAEDAEAAGPADRRDDVATVAESEDGELDAEQVTDAGVHHLSRL